MEANKLRTLEKFLRKEMRRHFLSERERIIAETILEMSLGWGNRSVRVPILDDFADLTGIQRPHAHSTLKALEEMRLIQREEIEGITQYTIVSNPELWKVKIRIPRATQKRALEKIKAVNGLDHQDVESVLAQELQTKCNNCANQHPQESPKNFNCCPNAILFGCSVTNSETVTNSANPANLTPYFPNLI